MELEEQFPSGIQAGFLAPVLSTEPGGDRPGPANGHELRHGRG